MLEPDIRAFFKRIGLTLLSALTWLLFNTTIGIMYDFAFIEEKLTTGNIIFYAWILVSFVLLIVFIYRLWKKPLH
ncbi:MAG: hypothetical protein J0I41_06760 [Filimonas sp.]|nr:hypothetical protein [Filimonas sp.]